MAAEMIELVDKYCLITGATSGIGEVTARSLASMGMQVSIACRNRDKGYALKEELEASSRHPVNVLVGDFSRLADVRQVAHDYLSTNKPLHLLVNNAGIVNTSRQLTEDGYEEMFAVNHLAPFLLTNLLLPVIKESAPARIVNVASHGHTFVKNMGFDDLQAERQFKTFKVYGRSKLANILFTRELSSRLQGLGVTANSLHPGAVSTGLGLQNQGFFSHFLASLLRPFFKSPEQGAATSLHVATAKELEGVSGKYFSNCKETRPKPCAENDAEAARLWQLSCEMTGFSN
jgi:retinol dehydrogenase-12